MDSDELRLKIIRLIEANAAMSQRQNAEESDISLGNINYGLRALAEIGWIKVGNFAKSVHKLGYLYLNLRGITGRAEFIARFF